MRVIFAYLLLTQLIFGLGVRSYVVLDWKFHQDEITEKYCVNKDKPMMNCNGKCYLSKKLENLELKEKEERKKHPSPLPLVENTNYSWIVKFDIPEPVIYTVNDIHKKGTNPPTFWYHILYHDIDHPPQV